MELTDLGVAVEVVLWEPLDSLIDDDEDIFGLDVVVLKVDEVEFEKPEDDLARDEEDNDAEEDLEESDVDFAVEAEDMEEVVFKALPVADALVAVAVALYPKHSQADVIRAETAALLVAVQAA